MKVSITAMMYIPDDEKLLKEGKSVIALVGVDDGVYAVDFGRKKIDFMVRKDFRDAVNFLSEFVNFKSIYHTPNFTQRNLKTKPGVPQGVRYYDCGSITVFDPCTTRKDRLLVVEYLDTTKGKIPAHDHPKECIEVYLAAEGPYHGEFCDVGESHEPFCDKTVAVKMYL